MSSSEQPIDPQVIEQTKQQIRSLVSEIAQLSRAEMSPEAYYAEFLTRIVTALAAVGGAVWMLDGQGRLAMQFQINYGVTKLADDEKAQRRHSRLLHRTLSTGEGGLMPPHWHLGTDTNEEEAGNPTDFLLVMGPLKTDREAVGVIEVIQRPDTGIGTQKGYLRFVLQMCDLAGDFLKSHALRRFSDRQALWTQLEEFTRAIHASLNPRETAYTIANESRRLIDCDRVSVAIRRGGRCVIEAVSGQDLLDKRSNMIRFLANVTTEVVAAGDPVWYTGDTSDFPPQIEEAVQEYVDETHSKSVAIIPLKRARPEAEREAEEGRRARQPEPAFGALIVEMIEDSRLPDATVQRINVVARHTTTALGNALEHQSLFLMPLWQLIGKSRIVTEARHLPKTIAVTAAIIGVVLFLVFWQADYDLQAKGTLEPVDRHNVFAHIDGVVDELKVDTNSQVSKGQSLARLRSTELDVAITEATGQLATTISEKGSIQRQLVNERQHLTPEEQNRLSGKLAELQKNMESLRAKLTLYKKKQEDLEVNSPADGTIVTWDLENRLNQRPVARGQELMRVGNLEGRWQLELHMPEDRLGAVAQAQRDLPDYQGALPVIYILASDPGAKHKGTVKKIQANADVKGDEGSTVLVKVDIEKNDLPLGIRPGTQVTAKVYCGRRSIGYVWFYDFVGFVQSRVLFRL